MGLKTSFNGVSLPPQKVSNPAIEDAPLPKRVVLPLGQNGNRVCKPVVDVGEQVQTGQLIGQSDDFLVAPVHSSVSGTITAIRPWVDLSGNEMLSVIVESDGNDSWLEEIRADEGFSDKESEQLLTDLERDPLLTADRLDWTAKLRLLDGYRQRDGLDWDAPKLRLLDLQYHDVDPKRGLYNRLAAAGHIKRLFTDDEVLAAVKRPPERTRAYFRGSCVSRFGEALVAANWDSLVFDIGEDSLRRVPMMEPLRGGRDRVGGLLDRADTPADLLRALGGDDE